MTRRLLFIAALMASTPLSAQTPAVAPAPAAPAQDATADDDAEDIVVTGQRERGSVKGDIPPEIQIRPAEIRALGANSIAEVLEAIAPQTGSGRGRGDGAPIVLLGGRRISGFGEIRDLPAEAIARIDILPEEVALKYGYRADSRVVNIVLRRRFNAITAELEPGIATGGGRFDGQGELGYLAISNDGRISLNSEYQHQDRLTESERDISLVPGSTIDARPFRTLLPETDRFALNGTISRSLPGNVAASLNGRFEDTATQSGFGIIGSDPLTRDSNSRTAHIGLSLNGDIAPWRWSFTANADRSRDRSLTDNATFGGRDRARAVNRSLNSDLVASGPLFNLPAGEVLTTVKAGFEFRGFDSNALRGGVATAASLERDTASVQASFDLPIASRRRAVLSPLGDLSFNVNIARDRLSDFGTLSTFGYGLNWSPFPILDLIASVTREDGAPSVQQLGNPLISTPNARVFDVSRGETVDITRIDGGNLALLADNRRVLKLGATLKPLHETDLTLRADYTRERVNNAIASFPSINPAIEAAFPDRFTRDGSGRLLRIDNRPVNFARTANDQLRWGLNFSKAIGAAPSPEALAKLREQFRANRPPGAGGGPDGPRRDGAGPRGGGGGRGFGGGGGDFGRARLQLGLFHTWRLKNTVLIRPGVPALDLLDGGSIGARGGQPRHQIEAQAGLAKNGFGARATANWTSATSLRADPLGAPSASDLSFGSLTTFNLRLFADLSAQRKLVAKSPWLRGFRVRLSVDNLFDAKPRVRDANGLTPVGYQPDLLDPLGRTITLSIRKQFR